MRVIRKLLSPLAGIVEREMVMSDKRSQNCKRKVTSHYRVKNGNLRKETRKKIESDSHWNERGRRFLSSLTIHHCHHSHHFIIIFLSYCLDLSSLSPNIIFLPLTVRIMCQRKSKVVSLPFIVKTPWELKKRFIERRLPLLSLTDVLPLTDQMSFLPHRYDLSEDSKRKSEIQ